MLPDRSRCKTPDEATENLGIREPKLHPMFGIRRERKDQAFEIRVYAREGEEGKREVRAGKMNGLDGSDQNESRSKMNGLEGRADSSPPR